MNSRTTLAAVTATLLTLASATPAAGQVPLPTHNPHGDPAPDTGAIEILKQDPDGTTMTGATFAVFDGTGTQIAAGTTDSTGKLGFSGLDSGVYRITETASGSELHDIAPDQNVIVPPGATASVTIVDPFKPADLTLTKTDQDTGAPLADATIDLTPATGGTTLTITTGPDGTARLPLPVTTRTGTQYTATETNAPPGYALNDTPVVFTAEPATPVAVTLTNTKSATAPTPDPDNPDEPPAPEDTPEPDTNLTPPAPAGPEQATNTAPHGDTDALAATGSPTTLAAAITALILTIGAGLLWTARRFTTNKNT